MAILPSQDEKQLSHTRYSAMVDTWYTNSLELDKSLLTISAGGIGLSFTMIQIFNNSIVFYFMVSASTFFTMTIGIVLIIFHCNGKRLLQKMVIEKQYITTGDFDDSPNGTFMENALHLLDKARNITFFVGIIIFSISIFFASQKNTEDKKPTSTINHTETQNEVNNSDIVREYQSSNNVNITITDNSKLDHINPVRKNTKQLCNIKTIASENKIAQPKVECCSKYCQPAQ